MFSRFFQLSLALTCGLLLPACSQEEGGLPDGYALHEGDGFTLAHPDTFSVTVDADRTILADADLASARSIEVFPDPLPSGASLDAYIDARVRILNLEFDEAKVLARLPRESVNTRGKLVSIRHKKDDAPKRVDRYVAITGGIAWNVSIHSRFDVDTADTQALVDNVIAFFEVEGATLPPAPSGEDSAY
ncbi:MAG: hypothetical protein ACFBZ8_11090 [Opitutales bacterium]